jgi:hypothetical protein
MARNVLIAKAPIDQQKAESTMNWGTIKGQ